jgi:putative cardiolipin synthase
MASIPLFMPSLGAALRAVAAGMLALALAGCATAPPLPRPPAGQALAPGPDGPLADAERAFAMRHGDAQSGFKVLQANHDALAWRLAVIDSARHSLDLQYYVWFGDKVGQLLLARVMAAADRGVKVRLLFDDLNTLLHDMGSVELRDAALAQVDRHPEHRDPRLQRLARARGCSAAPRNRHGTSSA